MKRVFALLLLALLALSGCQAAPERRNNRANQAYADQAYSEALRDYLAAQAELAGQPEPGYNAANTHYRQGDLLAAQVRLRAAIAQMESGDPLLPDAWFNLGNTFYRMEAYAQAASSYTETLRLNPNDQDAKHNLELALEMLGEPLELMQPSEEEETGTGQETQTTQSAQPSQDGPASQESPPEPPPSLTAEQARQLLEAAREGLGSLQPYLPQPGDGLDIPPTQDW